MPPSAASSLVFRSAVLRDKSSLLLRLQLFGLLLESVPRTSLLLHSPSMSTKSWSACLPSSVCPSNIVGELVWLLRSEREHDLARRARTLSQNQHAQAHPVGDLASAVKAFFDKRSAAKLSIDGNRYSAAAAISEAFAGEAPRKGVVMVIPSVAERPVATHDDPVSADSPKAAQPEHDFGGNVVLKHDFSGDMKPVEQTSRHALSIPGSEAATSGSFPWIDSSTKAVANGSEQSVEDANKTLAEIIIVLQGLASFKTPA